MSTERQLYCATTPVTEEREERRAAHVFFDFLCANLFVVRIKVGRISTIRYILAWSVMAKSGCCWTLIGRSAVPSLYDLHACLLRNAATKDYHNYITRAYMVKRYWPPRLLLAEIRFTPRLVLSLQSIPAIRNLYIVQQT